MKSIVACALKRVAYIGPLNTMTQQCSNAIMQEVKRSERKPWLIWIRLIQNMKYKLIFFFGYFQMGWMVLETRNNSNASPDQSLLRFNKVTWQLMQNDTDTHILSAKTNSREYNWLPSRLIRRRIRELLVLSRSARAQCALWPAVLKLQWVNSIIH